MLKIKICEIIFFITIIIIVYVIKALKTSFSFFLMFIFIKWIIFLCLSIFKAISIFKIIIFHFYKFNNHFTMLIILIDIFLANDDLENA